MHIYTYICTCTCTYITMYTITIYIPYIYSTHMYRASLQMIIWCVEVMVLCGAIESHTPRGVQSTLTLAATSRLTADTSPDLAAT